MVGHHIISCKSFRYWLYIIFLRYFGTITIWYLHNHFVCDKLFVLLAIKILLSQYSKTWTTLLYYLGEFFCITFYAHPHSGWLFGLLFEQTCLKALTKIARWFIHRAIKNYSISKCFDSESVSCFFGRVSFNTPLSYLALILSASIPTILNCLL